MIHPHEVAAPTTDREAMGLISKAGDLTFKAFTLGLGVATVYLAGTFSVNVYRGLAWHNAQSKIENDGTLEQKS